MKFKEVTYKRNFSVNFMMHEHVHLGATLELNEGECPMEAVEAAHKFTMEACLKLFPDQNPKYSTVADNKPVPILEVKKTPEESMIEAITGCTSVDVLKTFEKLANSKPEFKKAYNETFKKLTHGK